MDSLLFIFSDILCMAFVVKVAPVHTRMIYQIVAAAKCAAIFSVATAVSALDAGQFFFFCILQMKFHIMHLPLYS